MIKTIGHSVRSVYNYAVAELIDVRKWLPSLKKKAALLLIDEELTALKNEVTQSRRLSARVEAVRYLIKKL
tara:strand:- start:2206 stop:2418 length:213 start_codon:yes stop_codon:yes gene_type:complete